MNEPAKVRLDRWLWAARFYKTRSAAKAAIDGGKIHCGGQRAKPSKEIGVGMRLTISRGITEEIIIVTALADRRGSATDAARLYRETPASVASRETAAAQRRWRGAAAAPPIRPDRRARRELLRMKQSNADDTDDADA